MIGEESDESDVKIKEKWFGKQNRKEEETKSNKAGGENNDEIDKKNFGNWFSKQDKRKLMATNY